MHPSSSAQPLDALDASARQLRAAARVCLAIALAMAGLYALFFAYHAAATITFPFDLDWGEGYVLNDAVRLARGEQIYGDIQQFPMIRSPYPPLFLALDALLMQILGVGFAAGRLLSSVATLATAWLAGLVARQTGAARPAGWLAGLLVLGSPYVYQWSPYGRVDMLAIAAEMLALLVAIVAPTRRGLVLAGAVCAAALLTKQTAMAVPAGIGLWLLFTRPRQLPWFILGVGLPTAVAVAALAAGTQGQFVTHVITGNSGNPTNLARLIRFQAEFTILHPLVVVAALAFGLSRLRHSPLANSTLVAWLLSLSVASEASSVNYFLEFVAIGAPAAAVGWTRFVRHDPGRRFLTAGLALLQMALLFHVPNTIGVWPSFFAPHGFTPSAGDLEAGRRLDEIIQQTPGEVLVEPAGFAVRNGRRVWVQPLDLRAEQLRGRWRSDLLRETVRQQRYALIVLSYGLFPDDVAAEIRREYGPAETVISPNGLRYTVYRPVA